jgi:hypothetical protein
MVDEQNDALRARSGEVTFKDDRLTSFLYDLMKSHVPPGVVEQLVRESEPVVTYCNGWLAQYSKDLADRLRLP